MCVRCTLTGMRITTRIAEAGDLDRAAEVLGDAFADYPWTRWTVDPSDHQRRISALQRIALEHFGLRRGAISVSSLEGTIHSVAAWTDTAAVSAARIDDRAMASQVAELEGTRHHASRVAEQQVEGLRPDQRHLYLGTVGTSQAMQGRGLASRSLAPLFQAGDESALEIWLETSSQTNVEFYQRLGFTVANHFVIDSGGPPVWAMVRKPTSASTSGNDCHLPAAGEI